MSISDFIIIYVVNVLILGSVYLKDNNMAFAQRQDCGTKLSHTHGCKQQFLGIKYPSGDIAMHF